MARRLSFLASLVAASVVALPAAAMAEDTARLDAPANGSVTGAIEVRFSLARDASDPEARSVRVRAAGASGDHDAPCVAACSSSSPVHAFDLDPRSGSPFLDGPLPNGPLEFDVRVRRTAGNDRDAGRLRLNLRLPGSAVGGLSATAQTGEVRVAWSRAPEPDVTGYRVERCLEGCSDGAWDTLAVQPPSTSSFTDRPRPGSYDYRVVTTRSSGGDGSIETVSSPVTTTVDSPAPAPGVDEGPGSAGAGAPDGSASTAPPRTGSPEVEDGERGGAADDRDGAGGSRAEGTTPEVGPDDDASPSDASDLDDPSRVAPEDGRDDAGVDVTGPDGEAAVLGASDAAAGSSLRRSETGRVPVLVAAGLLLTLIGAGLRRRVHLSR